jgi:hypothetical protein
MRIKLVIKPRRDTRKDRGPPERRRSIMMLKKLRERSEAEGWIMVGWGC